MPPKRVRAASERAPKADLSKLPPPGSAPVPVRPLTPPVSASFQPPKALRENEQETATPPRPTMDAAFGPAMSEDFGDDSLMSPEGVNGPSFSAPPAGDAAWSTPRRPPSLHDLNQQMDQLVDDDTVVNFNEAGVAEFVVNVRVTRRRRLPKGVQTMVRAKELWKPRLLRITAPHPDRLEASHRAMVEVFRLKAPETGSRVTNGLIQRVFLRSLDNIRRGHVAPKEALPFWVPVEPLAATVTSSPRASPRAGPANPLGSDFSSSRPRSSSVLSTSSAGGKMKMAREFRFGHLLLGLSFVTKENKDLHDLRVEEQHLREVARKTGIHGLTEAASRGAASGLVQSPMGFAGRVKSALANFGSKESSTSKKGDKKDAPSSTTSNSNNNNNAAETDDTEDVIDAIDICFPNAKLRDAWYEWSNDFIIRHELADLREDAEAGLGLRDIARQRSIAALVHKLASTGEADETDIDRLGGQSSLFGGAQMPPRSSSGAAVADGGGIDFGDQVHTSGETSQATLGGPSQTGTHALDESSAAAAVSMTRPVRIPERPTQGVSSFVDHFTSVDPTKAEKKTFSVGAELAAAAVKAAGKEASAENKPPLGGKVKRVLAKGKTADRKFEAAKTHPGTLNVTGPLLAKPEKIDLNQCRILVESPWSVALLIIGDINVETITATQLRAIAATYRHRERMQDEREEARMRADPEAAALARAQAKITDDLGATVREYRFGNMEDRNAMAEWLLDVVQTAKQPAAHTRPMDRVDKTSNGNRDETGSQPGPMVNASFIGGNASMASQGSPHHPASRDLSPGTSFARRSPSPAVQQQQRQRARSTSLGARKTSILSQSDASNGLGSPGPSSPGFGAPAGRGASFTTAATQQQQASAGLGSPLSHGARRASTASINDSQASSDPSRPGVHRPVSGIARGQLAPQQFSPRQRAWTTQGAYAQTFLSPEYKRTAGGKGDRQHRRGSSAGGGSSQDPSSSEDSDSDELPEYMIARPLDDDAPLPAHLSGSTTTARTPPHHHYGGESGRETPSSHAAGLHRRVSVSKVGGALNMSRSAGHLGSSVTGGMSDDDDVFAQDELGAWCYASFHMADRPPTAQSAYAFRHVHLTALEPLEPHEQRSLSAAERRERSGRLIVLNAAPDLASHPCIDAAGADIVRVDTYTAAAGGRGIRFELRAGRSASAVLNVVPPSSVCRRRMLLFLEKRLNAPISVLSAAGAFTVTTSSDALTANLENSSTATPPLSPGTAGVGLIAFDPSLGSGAHSAAATAPPASNVLAGISRIMAKDKDRELDTEAAAQAPVLHEALEELRAANSAHHSSSAASADPDAAKEALRRHLIAEAAKEVEAADPSALLPCALCGVANRGTVNVCAATGLFHRDALYVRARDMKRGLLTSVFDDLPASAVEVPRPPSGDELRADPHKAAVPFNQAVDRAVASARAAIETSAALREALLRAPRHDSAPPPAAAAAAAAPAMMTAVAA